MKKFLKITVRTLGALLALIVAVLVAVPLVLTPERLTEWTRKYGTEYLVDGRVDVSRVDLTVWSTFPHAELTVDSLRVVNLNPAIPPDCRTVAAIDRLSGRLNLAALLIGRISISHVDIDRPQATLWQGPDSLSSLSILPPTANDEEPDNDEPTNLPDIRLHRFAISGDGTFRYISAPDSIDAAITIRQTRLDGRDEIPQYRLTIDSRLGALPYLPADSLTLAVDGSIEWDPSEPTAVGLHNLEVDIDSVRTMTSLKARFGKEICLDALDFRLKPVRIGRLSALASEVPQLAGIVPQIEGDAAVEFSAKLRKPYTIDPADTVMSLPDMTARLKIDEAPLSVPEYFLALNSLALDVKADISERGLDASTVDIDRLRVLFPASDFTLKAKVARLESDPEAKGRFEGTVNFTNMNPKMWRLLGMRLRGRLDADVDFNFSLSDLTLNTFHRARLDGDASLRDFEAIMPADTVAGGLTRARLAFGSKRSFGETDSLLSATINVDSAWVFMPELTANLADMKLSVGVANDSQTADTTRITPMGGVMSLRLLRYKSAADSTRASLRDLNGDLSLTRFKGEGKLPVLRAAIKARRLAYADGATRMSLRDTEIRAGAYRTPRRQRRRMSTADSLRWAARRDSMILAQQKFERIDLDIDRSAVSLLRRWHVNGYVKAKSGRLRTPLFPLRTRMRDLDFRFSPDSMMLNSLYIKAGHSDLALSGQITNIQRALGRRVGQPLHLRLNLVSDTLNVNELTQAAFRGAAWQATAEPGAAATTSDEEFDDMTEAADTASGQMMAIVVPMNIDAEVNAAASNIIYSTMRLSDFRGTVSIANGAAYLKDLHASTDIGSADLNMLYYAPTRSDVNFGMALDLNRFQIGRVTELMPALDSIMPILKNLGGVISASVSATTPVDSMLNIKFPELRAMVRLTGDSLKVLDDRTFKTVSKWLLFRDKRKNMIDHMDVRVAVEDNRLNLYPFMFDFDRYRIGVMGGNDMNMNLNYHVSILKSPIPFKFGINIKGTSEKLKIRPGRARFKENMAGQSIELSDTIRVNLAREISNVFRRGAKKARLAPLDIRKPEELQPVDEQADTISADERRFFIEQGVIEAPADSAAVNQETKQ